MKTNVPADAQPHADPITAPCSSTTRPLQPGHPQAHPTYIPDFPKASNYAIPVFFANGKEKNTSRKDLHKEYGMVSTKSRPEQVDVVSEREYELHRL